MSPVSVTGVFGKVGKGITGAIAGLAGEELGEELGEGEEASGDPGSQGGGTAAEGSATEEDAPSVLTHIGRSVTGDDNYEFGQYTVELFDKGMEAVGKVKDGLTEDQATAADHQVVFAGYGEATPPASPGSTPPPGAGD